MTLSTMANLGRERAPPRRGEALWYYVHKESYSNKGGGWMIGACAIWRAQTGNFHVIPKLSAAGAARWCTRARAEKSGGRKLIG